VRRRGLDDVRGATVVVTGASSGIGRATAQAFAGRGANVVLAARDARALADAARECEAAGGAALAVPTDVADEEAVRMLAARAVERFGRIDAWVNNAGVIVYGPFEDTPAEVPPGHRDEPVRPDPRHARRARALPGAGRRGADQCGVAVWEGDLSVCHRVCHAQVRHPRLYGMPASGLP
jgi:NAD(P)-dependent dehydrogenase (short-subunit alcohol dehydrogenase family)